MVVVSVGLWHRVWTSGPAAARRSLATVPEEVGEERANRHEGPPRATLAGLAAALDVLCADQPGLLTGPEQLGLLKDSLRLGARLHAWLAELAARIDTAGVAWQEHGTSTSTWLADAANLTRREAARLIAAGHGLARFPLVGDAAATGSVLPGQAEAITAVLDDLPGGLRAGGDR